jgi:hypothetical protein
MKTTLPNKSKIYLTLGGKGGVGKTVCAALLADYFSRGERAFAAYDADEENRGKSAAFGSMLPMAVSVNLRSVEDCDNLLIGAAEWPVTVADLPANAGGDFFAWWEAVATPETLAALNLELFGVGVIAPEAGSVASVIEWAARLQETMKFIIALNHRGSQRVAREREKVFSEYFASGVGRRFRESLRPKEFEIPHLYAGSMLALARARTLPSFAADDRSVPLLDRSRIKSWAETVHYQLEEIL